jgi:DNA-binding Lrp family transcriptional regulator
MDRVDRAILGHPMHEGRLSNTELADRVGLSPSPCLRRVRILERAGVITGYHAAVDMAALGRGFEVYPGAAQHRATRIVVKLLALARTAAWLILVRASGRSQCVQNRGSGSISHVPRSSCLVCTYLFQRKL